MAPESERAKELCWKSLCNFAAIYCDREKGHDGDCECSTLIVAEPAPAVAENSPAQSETSEGQTRPKEPTLTCSEVVERLPMSARVFAETYVLPPTVLQNEGVIAFAEAYVDYLHSWRERRVQELEELIAKHSGCSHCNDSAADITSTNDSTENRRAR